jgi:alpha-1,2-mannosyltransferase
LVATAVKRILRYRLWVVRACFALGLVGAPLAFIVLSLTVAKGRGFDFHAFWDAGRDVLHGRSPYPGLDTLPAVADRLTFRPFVYPAPAAFLMAPFAVLPYPLALALFALASVAATAGALYLLDVRDWRCYGAAFAAAPTVGAIGGGTVSPFLLLGAAALWRYRAAWRRAGTVLASLVVLKLFLWPLAAFLLATRRYRAALAAAALALAVTLGGWAAIGFAGLRDYPHLLDRLTGLVGVNSFSPYALAVALGLPQGAAKLAFEALSLAAFVGIVWAGRRLDERRLFVLALGAALAFTPILWPHYLVLVFVPIALTVRGFSLLWLAPLLFTVYARAWSNGDPPRMIPIFTITIFVFAVALRSRETGPRRTRVGLRPTAASQLP